MMGWDMGQIRGVTDHGKFFAIRHASRGEFQLPKRGISAETLKVLHGMAAGGRVEATEALAKDLGPHHRHIAHRLAQTPGKNGMVLTPEQAVKLASEVKPEHAERLATAGTPKGYALGSTITPAYPYSALPESLPAGMTPFDYYRAMLNAASTERRQASDAPTGLIGHALWRLANPEQAAAENEEAKVRQLLAEEQMQSVRDALAQRDARASNARGPLATLMADPGVRAAIPAVAAPEQPPQPPPPAMLDREGRVLVRPDDPIMQAMRPQVHVSPSAVPIPAETAPVVSAPVAAPGVQGPAFDAAVTAGATGQGDSRPVYAAETAPMPDRTRETVPNFALDLPPAVVTADASSQAHGGKVKGYSGEDGNPAQQGVTPAAGQPPVSDAMAPAQADSEPAYSGDPKELMLGDLTSIGVDPKAAISLAATFGNQHYMDLRNKGVSIPDAAVQARSDTLTAISNYEGVPPPSFGVPGRRPVETPTPAPPTSAAPSYTAPPKEPAGPPVMVGGFIPRLPPPPNLTPLVQDQTTAMQAVAGANSAIDKIKAQGDLQQYKIAQDADAQIKQQHDANMAQQDALFQQIRTHPPDPNRLWTQAATGDKIQQVAGLFLGTLGSGMAHVQNAALELYNQAIDHDMDAQRMQLQSDQNALKYLQDRGLSTDQYLAQEKARKLTSAAALLQSQIDSATPGVRTAEAQQQVAALKQQAALTSYQMTMERVNTAARVAQTQSEIATANMQRRQLNLQFNTEREGANFNAGLFTEYGMPRSTIDVTGNLVPPKPLPPGTKPPPGGPENAFDRAELIKNLQTPGGILLVPEVVMDSKTGLAVTSGPNNDVAVHYVPRVVRGDPEKTRSVASPQIASISQVEQDLEFLRKLQAEHSAGQFFGQGDRRKADGIIENFGGKWSQAFNDTKQGGTGSALREDMGDTLSGLGMWSNAITGTAKDATEEALRQVHAAKNSVLGQYTHEPMFGQR